MRSLGGIGRIQRIAEGTFDELAAMDLHGRERAEIAGKLVGAAHRKGEEFANDDIQADNDGGQKCWVRMEDGSDFDIVPGSQVKIVDD